MFDIRLSDEQREFQNLARKFAQKRSSPRRCRSTASPTGRSASRGTAEAGLAARLPDLRADAKRTAARACPTTSPPCLVAEELAAGELGTAYYFMLTARRARDWFELRMTPEQKAYFLPKFLDDDLYFTTVAIHEPDTDVGFDYFTETPDNVRLEDAGDRAARRVVDHQRREELPDRRLSREAARRHGADAGRREAVSRRRQLARPRAPSDVEARAARRRQRGDLLRRRARAERPHPAAVAQGTHRHGHAPDDRGAHAGSRAARRSRRRSSTRRSASPAASTSSSTRRWASRSPRWR